MIELAPVGSDFVVEAGYDADLKVCQIRLVTSPEILYTYSAFPVETWNAFLAAPSKATFFANNIKGRFTTSKD